MEGKGGERIGPKKALEKPMAQTKSTIVNELSFGYGSELWCK